MLRVLSRVGVMVGEDACDAWGEGIDDVGRDGLKSEANLTTSGVVPMHGCVHETYQFSWYSFIRQAGVVHAMIACMCVFVCVCACVSASLLGGVWLLYACAWCA